MKILQPTYTLQRPSDKKTIKYRPFTVKEEKSLILAIEEDNLETTISVIEQLVDACTYGEINEDSPYFDVEYAFLFIRSKSVGESIDMIGGCECSEKSKTNFVVNIEECLINFSSDYTDTFRIPDSDTFIKIKYPTIRESVSTLIGVIKSAEEDVLSNIIGAVYNEEEVHDSMTPEEKVELVESLNPKQQNAFASHISKMPSLSLKSNYTCKMCNKHHSVDVAGILDFFV